MGLFDRFGAGGGKLELTPNALQLSPGQVLEGRVSFTAGSRTQQITNIKLKFNQSLTRMEQTPQGPQQRSHQQLVVPEITVAGQFAAEPGNRYDFPFRIQLPAQMVSSVPQVCHYRISVSADIDNEIDPGAGNDIQIVGGVQPGMGAPMMGQMPGAPMMGQMPGAPMMGQMPGAPMMGQMPGAPMMGGVMGAVAGAMGAMGGMPGQMPGAPMMGQMPGAPMMGQMPGAPMMGQMPGAPMMGQMPGAPMMGQMPGAPAQIGVGSPVLAQWQDGQFHPGRVVQMQNGYYAVDWDNPQLGQTTWVAQHQIQAPMMGQMPGAPMMGQMPGAPMMGQMPGAPMMGQMPQKMPDKPVMAKQAGVQPGSLVYGQGPDGQWHPGRVVQSQNGYHAVDWENAKLGATVWLSDAQIKSR